MASAKCEIDLPRKCFIYPQNTYSMGSSSSSMCLTTNLEESSGSMSIQTLSALLNVPTVELFYDADIEARPTKLISHKPLKNHLLGSTQSLLIWSAFEAITTRLVALISHCQFPEPSSPCTFTL